MKFCVIGLGRFGYHVATTLTENGMDVLGVESNEVIVSSIKDLVTQAICLQVHDEASLRSIGIDEMDTVIVAMGENVSGSILITALLKKRLKVPTVITRAISEVHKEILLLIGADQIVLPEQEIATQLANNLSLPFSIRSRINKQFSIANIKAPERFVGKTIKKLNLFEQYRVMCIGLSKGEEIQLMDKEYQINQNDILVLAGTNNDLEAIARL